MTVQEMHIEVNQATQGIAANTRRKMYPSELDWILNKVMLQYIGTHAASIREMPGAAESVTHLSRLTSLLDYMTLPTYKTEDGVAAVIPQMMQELLSVETFVHSLCGAPKRTLRSVVGKHYLKLPHSTANEEWFKQVQLFVNGELVFDIDAYVQDHNLTWNGFTATDESWRVRPLLIEALYRAGYIVYWEKYQSEYHPETIIIDDTAQATVALIIDGVTTTATYASEPKTQYLGEYVKRTPGRLVYQTTLPQDAAGAFTRTYYRSPLCLARDGAVEVRLDSSFIVRDLRLHGVRKPRQINVILGTNCELPENAHQDICDLATEYIKQLREDPNWEEKLKHNMIRTTV